jgi:hypothetical protein
VIVVDTTVWIDSLEATGTAFDRHLVELVERDAPWPSDRDLDALAGCRPWPDRPP